MYNRKKRVINYQLLRTPDVFGEIVYRTPGFHVWCQSRRILNGFSDHVVMDRLCTTPADLGGLQAPYLLEYVERRLVCR